MSDSDDHPISVMLDLLDQCPPGARIPAAMKPDDERWLVAGLEAHGAVVESGYASLSTPFEMISVETILRSLSPESRAWLGALQVHREHPSTNTALLEQAYENSVEGLVATTEYQSAGRGRRGRSWMSLYASNIAVSLGASFDSPAQLEGWSLAVGIAVVNAIRNVGAVDAMLKWPNDVWWRERKVAGILVETTGFTRVQAIAGIGVNVRVPAAARTAVDQAVADVSEAAGHQVSRNALLVQVIQEFHKTLLEFRSGGMASLTASWDAMDVLRGRQVVVSGAESGKGVAQGINSSGELLLATADGVRAIRSGEVSVRPAH